MATMIARTATATAFVVMAAILAWSYPARSAETAIERGSVRVLDGDTVRLNGAKPDVRLNGFNAPETRRAKCEAERELGAKATRRLRDLVNAGNLTFEEVACSCAPGTAGTMRCNYGRRCGTLRSAGRDVGEILIAEKLAVPFVCGATRCPKTPKPWCEG